MEHRITSPGPLLTPAGGLREPGWATSLLLRYDRGAIRASRWRIKEWDYYLVANDRYGVALTVTNLSYMAMVSASLLDFGSGGGKPWEQTTSLLRFFPGNKFPLPATSEAGDIVWEVKGGSFAFYNDGKTRRLSCHLDKFKDGKPFDVDFTLTDPPRDSMVIATPFKEDEKAFYYNQKINCMKADGKAVFDGREYLFSPVDSFGMLDWGRGVWTRENTWYWGTGSGLAEGVPFGYNIGYGFGDTSAASENMLFYDGVAHKLALVSFNIPQKDGKNDYLSPWTYSSSDGRFEMDFVPIIDRFADINAGLIHSCQHQVFGRLSGRAVLDDGKVITLKDFLGSAEVIYNKW